MTDFNALPGKNKKEDDVTKAKKPALPKTKAETKPAKASDKPKASLKADTAKKPATKPAKPESADVTADDLQAAADTLNAVSDTALPVVYEAPTTDVSVELAVISDRIKTRMKRTVEDVLEIGKDLKRIKDLLPHGQFMPYLQTQFGMGYQTAHNFMNVAAKFSAPENLQMLEFPASALYELAAPSTPESVVEHVKDKKAKGETVTVSEIKELKDKIKAEEKAKAALEKEKAELAEKLKKAEADQVKLNEHIDKLQNAPAKIEYQDRVPEEFKSEAEAVATMQEQKRALSQEIGEIQGQLERLQSSSDLQNVAKREQVKAVYDALNKTLGLIVEHQHLLTEDDYILSDETSADYIRQMADAMRLWAGVLSPVADPVDAAKTINVVPV